tara:strand:+ start:76 stop:306 length:231 start_codon:yes stop_codon:yes gene_type:complete
MLSFISKCLPNTKPKKVDSEVSIEIRPVSDKEKQEIAQELKDELHRIKVDKIDSILRNVSASMKREEVIIHPYIGK